MSLIICLILLMGVIITLVIYNDRKIAMQIVVTASNKIMVFNRMFDCCRSLFRSVITLWPVASSRSSEFINVEVRESNSTSIIRSASSFTAELL